MGQRTDAWNSSEHNSAEYMHWVLRRLSYLAEGKPVEQIQSLIVVILADTDRWEHNANLITSPSLKMLHLSSVRFAKGIIKSWRTYLIEREHQPSQSSPSGPPSETKATSR